MTVYNKKLCFLAKFRLREEPHIYLPGNLTIDDINECDSKTAYALAALEVLRFLPNQELLGFRLTPKASPEDNHGPLQTFFYFSRTRLSVFSRQTLSQTLVLIGRRNKETYGFVKKLIRTAQENNVSHLFRIGPTHFAPLDEWDYVINPKTYEVFWPKNTIANLQILKPKAHQL